MNFPVFPLDRSNIGCPYYPVTKIGTRIKDRMRKDPKLRKKMLELEGNLCRVKD